MYSGIVLAMKISELQLNSITEMNLLDAVLREKKSRHSYNIQKAGRNRLPLREHIHRL